MPVPPEGDTLCFVEHERAPIGLDPNACVTASGLVRRFGLWQERAAHMPVFVLRRGRPSLVMTSIELMRRLCASQSSDQDRTDRILGALREAVIEIDGHGRVRMRNRAAQLAFPTATGASLSELVPDPAARQLADLAARARYMDSVEHGELAIGHGRFRVALVPQDDGALLIVRDITRDFAGEACAAELAALSASIDRLGIATARINLRGIVTCASDALAAMIGAARSSITGIRFTTIFDCRSQPVVDRAIEDVLDEAAPRVVDCAITLTNDRQHIRVCITPIRMRDEIAGVCAAIMPQIR